MISQRIVQQTHPCTQRFHIVSHASRMVLSIILQQLEIMHASHITSSRSGLACRPLANVPGVLLPHMRPPPLERADLDVAGPCLWDGGPLLCPPDGLCFLYAWLAALSPQEWHRVEKDAHGFINDPAEEALWKGRAKTLLDRCVALMEAEGEMTMASQLKAGGYPGDEEFAYYSRALGGAFLVTPLEEAQGFAVIHGLGPVQCEFGFVYSRDGDGHAAGHYVLLRSWATCSLDGRPSAEGVVSPVSDPLLGERRRLRGKQPPPPGYPPAPSLLKKPATGRIPARPKRAWKQGQSHFCSGGDLGPCHFGTRQMGQASRGKQGQRCCNFCQKPEMDAALRTSRGRGSISRVLKAFASFAEQDVLQEALRRIGVWAPDWLPTFAAKAKEAKRSKRPAAARVAAAADRAELKWTETRGKRKRCWGPPSGSERKAFRSAVLADQRFAKKRFFGDVPRRARGKGDDLLAIVPNDSDLPAANLSATSIGLQKLVRRRFLGHVSKMPCSATTAHAAFKSGLCG